MSDPSKVTKVLIDRIHGGRKKDSKFWQSEFSDEEIAKPKPTKPSVFTFIFYPLLVLALIILGFVFYNVWNRFFITLDPPTKRETVRPKSNYSPPVYKKKPYSNHKKATYSNNSKDRPVTKRELDRAIAKALNKQTIPNSTTVLSPNHSTLSHYRVELTNGSVIEARSAIANGLHFRIKDTSGMEISMLRKDIKSVEKVFLE